MKTARSLRALVVSLALLSATIHDSKADRIEVGPLLKDIRDVGPKGQGHLQAIAAMRELSVADARQLPEILAGMDGAGKLATNWIRSACENIAQRALNHQETLPQQALEKFLADTSHAPRARRLAYELILLLDQDAKARLIPHMLNDPSLELRRDAVTQAISRAKSLIEDDHSKAATRLYRQALTAARDLDQIQAATKELRELGEIVDLPSHFGFVMRWKLIGPFDNTNKSGFDVAYPPEKEIDLSRKYAGKMGAVKWFHHEIDDEFGIVDLTKALDKHKGAIAYAYSEFVSDRDQDVDLRLGCINANKVWLNGKLLTSNQVYHANTQIDQYVGHGQLNKGRNQILIKICQNEQEEGWAQRWQFQLRVCDQFGTAILSQDRPLAQTTSLERLLK